MRTLLNGFGITYNDVKVDYLGYAEAADALKGGKIDAAILNQWYPQLILDGTATRLSIYNWSGFDPEKVKQIRQKPNLFPISEYSERHLW